MNRCLVWSLLVSVGFVASACSTSTATTPTAAPVAFLKITTISPAVGAELSKGSTVTLSLGVASELAYAGRITLSVKDQAGVSLLASEPSVDIGVRGEASLHATFVVPSMASSIEVLATFRPTEETRSFATIHIGYPTR